VAWGNVAGKVKTRRIGFIQPKEPSKTSLNNQRKSSNATGRKKTGSGPKKQSRRDGPKSPAR
jgi:hypothetical protein